MRKLIKADLRRVLRKPSFWILLALSLLMIGFYGILGASDQWPGYLFMKGEIDALGNCSLIYSILIFLCVFADEFRAMTMICAIGRGFSRTKIVLSKLLASLILIVFLFLISVACAAVCGALWEAQMTAEQTAALYFAAVIDAYEAFGCITIAALLLFVTNNIPISVFLLLGAQALLPAALYFLSLLPSVARFHLDRWYFIGFADRAFADYTMGLTGSAIGALLLGALLYIGGSVALTIAIFQRKELEF